MSDLPNIFWIMADQHNAKCTSWGRFPQQAHTPNLERLADSGVRFDSSHCQNPICTPSRVSYLTGRYASNHGYFGLSSELRRPLPNLFGWAAEQGYRTGAFGKIHTPDGLLEPTVDDIRSNDDHNEYLRERGKEDLKDSGNLPEWEEMGGGGQAIDARPARLPFEEHMEYWASDRAIEFIEDGDGPFCTWLSFSRPHQVYAPAEEFWEAYPDEDELAVPPTFDEDTEAAGKPPHHNTIDLDEEAPRAIFEPRTREALLRRKLRGYLGCITEVDALVGRVLDYLEEAGLREDTIVIYCADHGDFATEHGFHEKAPGISYDAITRVPFIWSWPGTIEAGEVNSHLVETIDLFPTLRSLVDGETNRDTDGHDLSGHLTGDGPTPTRTCAVTENPWARTIRTEDQKLTVYPPEYFGKGSETFLEFYDLAEDPWESRNLAAEYPEAVQRHRNLLYEHLVSNDRPFTTHPPIPEAEAADRTVDPACIRHGLANNEMNKNYM